MIIFALILLYIMHTCNAIVDDDKLQRYIAQNT